MSVLRKEHFPFPQQVMEWEETSPQNPCPRQYIYKSLTREGVQDSDSEALNPPVLQTRGRSSPPKWQSTFPVCNGEPALRSVDSWCPYRTRSPRNSVRTCTPFCFHQAAGPLGRMTPPRMLAPARPAGGTLVPMPQELPLVSTGPRSREQQEALTK